MDIEEQEDVAGLSLVRGERPEHQRGLLGEDLQSVTPRSSASSVASMVSPWVGSTAARERIGGEGQKCAVCR
jgi:hypothetical protein